MADTSSESILFHVPFASGEVDEENGIIRGVSLITGSLTAEGHELEVDDTTLKQVYECAAKMGKVPVKLNHGSGVENICGYMDNFRLDKPGGKVRGDWHLLTTHEETPKMLERAKRMPSCFGMSVAFKGGGEKKSGKKFARCHKLKAVDCVTDPAANPDGLFSAREAAPPSLRFGATRPSGRGVDTGRNGMADNNTTTQEPLEGSVAELLAELKGFRAEIGQLGERLSNIEQFHDSIIDQLGDVGELDDPNADPNGDGTDGAHGTNVNAGAEAGTVGAQLSALRKQVVELSAARQNDVKLAEEAEVDHAFSVIEAKVVALSEANAELVELNAKLKAENDALKVAVKTGTKAAAPGVESVTLFSAKNAPAGAFEQLVTQKFEELKGAGKTELSAKSEAIQFCVRKHSEAFAEYRQRGGKIQL